MSHNIKPKASIAYDKFDLEAENLLEEFHKTRKFSLLLQASENILKSKNPERQEISDSLLGLYFHQKGLQEKDLEESIENLERARELFLKASSKGETFDSKNLDIEILSRKIRLPKASVSEKKEFFLKSAELNKEIGKKKDSHANMSLYHMLHMEEMLKKGVEREEILKAGEAMLKEAQLSEHAEFVKKSEVILQQVRVNFSMSPEDALEEQRKLQEAIEKTEDKYGKEEAEADVLYIQGMIATNKTERERLFSAAGHKWLKIGNEKRAIEAIKMITPLPIKVMGALEMADSTLELQAELLRLLREAMPEGEERTMATYHHSYLLQHLKDFKIIATRLGESRKRLTELAIKRKKYEPKKIFKRKFSKKVQSIFKEEEEVSQKMRLDLDNLYIFGKIMLDQWSFVLGYLFGEKNPSDFDFDHLYNVVSGNKLKSGLIQVKSKHSKAVFWLYFQLKAHRNEFIEHVNKPWQKGMTRSVIGDDFNLHIPVPPNYISKEEKEKLLLSVRPLMPEALKKMPDDYWEKANLHRTLEVTFHRIHEIDSKENRQKVWDVWKKVGGSTPSYDKIAENLIGFLLQSTETVVSLLKSNEDRDPVDKKDASLPEREIRKE
ncbi:MAG: hypothetical protein HGB18_05200 [Candidatus Moranbacteria bacterium]|nr:hypothetical protein [Candidatus Moranbacteria bacterium]